jgi:hypothetical protein
MGLLNERASFHFPLTALAYAFRRAGTGEYAALLSLDPPPTVSLDTTPISFLGTIGTAVVSLPRTLVRSSWVPTKEMTQSLLFSPTEKPVTVMVGDLLFLVSTACDALLFLLGDTSSIPRSMTRAHHVVAQAHAERPRMWRSLRLRPCNNHPCLFCH